MADTNLLLIELNRTLESFRSEKDPCVYLNIAIAAFFDRYGEQTSRPLPYIRGVPGITDPVIDDPRVAVLIHNYILFTANQYRDKFLQFIKQIRFCLLQSDCFRETIDALVALTNAAIEEAIDIIINLARLPPVPTPIDAPAPTLISLFPLNVQQEIDSLLPVYEKQAKNLLQRILNNKDKDNKHCDKVECCQIVGKAETRFLNLYRNIIQIVTTIGQASLTTSLTPNPNTVFLTAFIESAAILKTTTLNIFNQLISISCGCDCAFAFVLGAIGNAAIRQASVFFTDPFLAGAQAPSLLSVNPPNITPSTGNYLSNIADSYVLAVIEGTVAVDLGGSAVAVIKRTNSIPTEIKTNFGRLLRSGIIQILV